MDDLDDIFKIIEEEENKKNDNNMNMKRRVPDDFQLQDDFLNPPLSKKIKQFWAGKKKDKFSNY